MHLGGDRAPPRRRFAGDLGRALLGRLQRGVEARPRRAGANLVEGSAREWQRAAALGLAGIDGGPHGQRDHPVAIEPGGQRIADAADRLLELLALALDLLDLPLELAGHAVELASELRELVVAVDGHWMSEVASAEPPRRGQEGVYLPCQRTSDDHRRDEGEHKEREEQLTDQQPVLSDLVVDLRRVTEHRELDRGTGRLVDSRHSSPVGVARQLELTRIAAGAERGAVAEAVDGGGEQGLFAKHGELEAGQVAHAREEVVGVDPRDAELAGLTAPDRQRSALRCDSRARPGASYHLSVVGAQDDRRDVAGLVDELPHALLHAATRPKCRAQARVRGDPAQLGLGALRGLVVDREGGAQAGRRCPHRPCRSRCDSQGQRARSRARSWARSRSTRRTAGAWRGSSLRARVQSRSAVLRAPARRYHGRATGL